jgi:hypothetical protein
MGGRAFIGFYLAGGMGGALLSYALMLLPHSGPVLGASAAVYAVMLAFAWYWPDEPIYVFPFPQPVYAKWLVAFAVLLSLILALPYFNHLEPGVAHVAHLGGFATAFIWLKVDGWRLTRAERHLRGAPERGVLVHPAARTARRGESKPRPRAPDRPSAEIDRVLDKISASGLSSLTPAEKRFLHEMSRKMRDRD